MNIPPPYKIANLSNLINPIQALTKERFEKLQNALRSFHFRKVSVYVGYREYYSENRDPPIEHRRVIVPIGTQTRIVGPHAGLSFAHHFLDQCHKAWSGRAELSKTPDERLSVKLVDTRHADGGPVRVFDFETDHSLDLDLQTKLADEAFIKRTVPHLGYYGRPDHILRKAEWNLLARLMYGFELLPGCWLHTKPSDANPGDEPSDLWQSFVIVDPERYSVIADSTITRQITENGYHQISLPTKDMGWLDAHEDHEPHIANLAEDLNKIICDKASKAPLPLAKPRLFVWERFAHPSP